MFFTGDTAKSFVELVEAAKDQAFVKHIETVSQSADDSLAFYQYYMHDFIRNLILPFDKESIESVYNVSIK